MGKQSTDPTGAGAFGYRPEIDGLRAVAVLPVILFHAGVAQFSGGFVGVDVFFVISGYLITSILLAEMTAGNFSLLRFYERRARRILPPLFLVMALSIPLAWLWLLPTDMKDFAQSLMTVPVFSSNFLFWAESGYFDADGGLKPLLHTWSLAVEEQYYVLFPLLLLALIGLRKRRVFTVLLAIGIASLIWAHWASLHAPASAFFLLPSRAWELVLGALAAIYLRDGRAMAGNQILSLLGLVMIAVSVIAFDEHTRFPGFPALMPTVGTLLVILFANAGTVTGRLLSLRPVVGIGLISYSAYLFHQPIFAFVRHRNFEEMKFGQPYAFSLLAFLLAYLSWRLVERPLRDRRNFSRNQIFGAGIVLSVAFVAIGFAAQNVNDDKGPAGLRDLVLRENRDGHVCAIDGWLTAAALAQCLRGAPAERVVLLGDSHAQSLSMALREELAQRNIALLSLTHPACLPIPDTSRAPIARWQSCLTFKSRAFDFIGAHPEYPVILSARWAKAIQGTNFYGASTGPANAVNRPNFVLNADGMIDKSLPIEAHIDRVLGELAKTHQLTIIGPVPEAGWDIPRRALKLFRSGEREISISTAYTDFETRNAAVQRMFDRFAETPVSVVDVADLVCNHQIPDRCVGYFDDRAYYHDDNHASYFFAQMIAREIVATLTRETKGN